MKKTYVIIAALCGVMLSADAIDVNMDNNDAPGKSSYNSAENWENDLPPGSGTNYFTNGKSMRSPDGGSVNDNHIFAGDSLTINGGALAWKSLGKLTVDNMIIDGGSLSHWRDYALGRLYGNVWINSGKTWRIEATGNNLRDFDIYSCISGPGSILVVPGLAPDQASKRIMFQNINTNFTGKIQFERDGQFGFTDERALGPDPSSYTYNQLSIYGGWIYLTNSISIDDPNRGINLRTSIYALNGGGFEVSDGSTATVSCLINGPGDLGKRGAGTLVLANNETFAGDTYIYGGELNIAPGASIQSSDIFVDGSTAILSGTGVYNTVTLLNGGSIRGLGTTGFNVDTLAFSGGCIGIDPVEDDPATPRITVTGSMTKDAFETITVNVLSLDTVQQQFKVMDAADLAGFTEGDLCVNPPWAGFLSIEDNGSGGKVLMLTTQPGDKIAYQNESDSINTTAFFKTNWTDHLAPSAGKIYVDENYTMRTPPNGINTFAGDRLIFNGCNLSMKGQAVDMTTVNDLVAMNQASMSLAEEPVGQISGNITLHPLLDSGRNYSLLLYGWTPKRSFHMFASLHGYGELRMLCAGNPAYGNSAYTLRAMNTNFFGRIRMDGDTNFTVLVSCEENLGGQPSEFRADQMIFNGGGISVTNNVVIDDPGRGFTLLDDGGISGTSTDSGSYTNGTPVEDRTYGGGAVFVAAEGSTLTIGAPITGPGDILKNGAGDVILSGSNSYTGLTEIVQGGLAGTTADAFGTSPVLVNGEGRLLTLYSESMPANGVELSGMIEFAGGGGVKVKLAEGSVQPTGEFSVPLFLLPEGESIDTGSITVEHTLNNVTAALTTSVVGSRTLVSATFTSYAGTIIILH